MINQIVINENIRHGKPVIKGTRVTAEEVLGALAGGMTYAEITREYGVKREGILAAIRYAAGWFRGEEVMLFAKSRVCSFYWMPTCRIRQSDCSNILIACSMFAI